MNCTSSPTSELVPGSAPPTTPVPDLADDADTLTAAWIQRVYGTVPGSLVVSHVNAAGTFIGAGGQCRTHTEAAERIAALEAANLAGIYLRVTTISRTLGATERGGAVDSHYLPGLWADVDMGTMGHAHDPAQHDGRTLPPDEAAARLIIARSGLPAPTLWVHSGGGMYPWWLLAEAVEVTNTNRADLATLSARWQTVIQESAHRLGYEYGAGVGDLARVLRVPGTTNRKAGLARPCRVIEDAGPKHTLAELLAALPAQHTAPKPAPAEWHGEHIFDSFAASTTWGDLLGRYEFTVCTARHGQDVLECFTRPGGPEHTCSAHVLAANPYVLVVWSESAGLPTGAGQRLTKGRVYAEFEHRGDLSAAAKHLAAEAQSDKGSPGSPGVGKDADHIAAGHTGEIEEEAAVRRSRITWANTIKPRPVIWAWKDDEGNGRIPSGSLSIAAGREGTGKSSFGIWMAAQITNGQLPGSYHGKPRRVLYVAMEDSWEHTIVPRLMAAGAALAMVGRFDVVGDANEEVSLSLPYDNRLLEDSIREHDVALVTIDPIMSVLGEKINASRSKEVRSALDPIVRIADRTGSVILGIAHFNKGSSSDPTLSITESKAFTDVPRSVFTFARDDENECRVMSQTKNSLGKDWGGLTSLKYTIDSTDVPTDEGPAEVGMFVWGGVAERSVGDIVRDRGEQGDHEERGEAKKWLHDVLTSSGNAVPATEVFKKAWEAGYSRDQIKRAKKQLKVTSTKSDMDSGWVWKLPEEPPKGNDEGDGKEGGEENYEGGDPPEGSTEGSEGSGVHDTHSLHPLRAPFVGSRPCPECGEPLPAGHVRHTVCFKTMTQAGCSAGDGAARTLVPA